MKAWLSTFRNPDGVGPKIAVITSLWTVYGWAGEPDPLAREWWPPLPAGRRLRALERSRREQLVLEARTALASVLHARRLMLCA